MEHKDTARISSSRYYKTPHVTTVKSPGSGEQNHHALGYYYY
jgi:hypothetical protein